MWLPVESGNAIWRLNFTHVKNTSLSLTDHCSWDPQSNYTTEWVSVMMHGRWINTKIPPPPAYLSKARRHCACAMIFCAPYIDKRLMELLKEDSCELQWKRPICSSFLPFSKKNGLREHMFVCKSSKFSSSLPFSQLLLPFFFPGPPLVSKAWNKMTMIMGVSNILTVPGSD